MPSGETAMSRTRPDTRGLLSACPPRTVAGPAGSHSNAVPAGRSLGWKACAAAFRRAVRAARSVSGGTTP